MAFLFGHGAKKLGAAFAKEMCFSTANELLFDGKAKSEPTRMSIVTDQIAKQAHDGFRAAQKLPKFPLSPVQSFQVPVQSLQVPVEAPKQRRVPLHNFTREEIAKLHKPFPLLGSQTLQKLMGHQVIDSSGAGELQRLVVQAAAPDNLQSNRD